MIWVGVEVDPTLRSLHEAMEEAMASLGFPREKRAFRPHLTLGRARRRTSPREFAGLDDLVETMEYHDVYRIGSVDVMKSRLTPRGAIYDVIHSAGLES